MSFLMLSPRALPSSSVVYRGSRQAGFWPVGIDVPSPANELLWSLDFVAQALLPVLSGHDKYHAHAFEPCRQDALHPTIIFERARGSRGPRTAPFLRGLGWGSRGPRQAGFWPVGIEMPLPANELLWSLDFVAQAPLPVLSGHDKYHAHAFQPCRKMPSIPLSSLSEPAGAGPEFARVGEPRASRKDDSGDIFHADSVRSHFEPDHTNYLVPTHYFDRASACAQRFSAEQGGREKDIPVINCHLYKHARGTPTRACEGERA